MRISGVLALIFVYALAALAIVEHGVRTPADPDRAGAEPERETKRESGAPALDDPGPAPPKAHTDPPVPRERVRRSLDFSRPDGETDVDTRPDAIASSAPDPDEGIDLLIVTPEGFELVPVTAAGEGRDVAYTVEVEPTLEVDPRAVAATVEEALHDPRSWASDVELRRVDDIGQADIRVVLAEPATVDELCGQVGLETVGEFSCWNGTFAALNARRWEDGADAFDDLTTYRRYLVNHEVGHGLGHGHEDCGAAGEPAPVMMQQTKGTDGCEANGWVYPERSSP